jgi:hypothetical protein
MRNTILIAFAVILTRASAASSAEIGLTVENIRKAGDYYAGIWNNGMPLMGGGVEMSLEDGEVVYDRDIALLAQWLQLNRRLPSLDQLLPLVQHENMACRIFAHECLRRVIKDLPSYSPYFKPGSGPEKIARVKAKVQDLIARKKLLK